MRVFAQADFDTLDRRALWRQVLLVYGSLEGALWTVGAVQGCFMVLTVALAVGWTLSERRSPTNLGLDPRSIRRGWWIAPIGAAVAGLILLAAWRWGTLRAPAGGLIAGENVALSLIWALMQQFLLQSFFFLRLEHLLRSGRRAVPAAALLFASAHIPNPVLVPVTLAGGLILSEVFRRHRALYPLAVAHALVALSLAISIPEAVLHDMRVGISYIEYRSGNPIGAAAWYLRANANLVASVPNRTALTFHDASDWPGASRPLPGGTFPEADLVQAAEQRGNHGSARSGYAGKPVAAANLGRTRADEPLTLKVSEPCALALAGV